MINFSETLRYQKLIFLLEQCIYGSTVFSFAGKAFPKKMRSVFDNDIGLQLLINLFSLFFFSGSLVMACFYDVESSLYVLAWSNDIKLGSVNSLQNAL